MTTLRGSLAILAALTLLGLPACRVDRSGDGAPAPTPAPGAQPAAEAQRITNALEKTNDSGSARLSMTMEMAGGSQDLTTTARGGMEFDTRRARMSAVLQFAGRGGKMPPSAVVIDGSVAYLEARARDGALPGRPGNKPWLKLPNPPLGAIPGTPFDVPDPGLPLALLAGLSDEVSEVGPADDGATTHYTGRVDIDDAIANAPDGWRSALRVRKRGLAQTVLDVHLWLDAEGYLRRVDIATKLQPGAVPEGFRLATSVRTRIELSDFGSDVDVRPPPPSQVLSPDDLLG